MRFSVIGAGGWGTAVARLLARQGHETTLWARDDAFAASLRGSLENKTYLPGVTLPSAGLTVSSDLEEALDQDVIILAVPSFAMPDLLDRIRLKARPDSTFINLAKGLDRATHQTMSELIEAAFPAASVFALSGPSHAEEVGRDIPTAVVLAGRDLDLGEHLQKAIATPWFRVYLSEDILGVELCATVKNVIALATGVSDGLGYGDNSRAALITRGLKEMVRFGQTFGVAESTFFGLSGLGDLVATCTSDHSRNRRVGFRLGQGEALDEILSGMAMVAEGVYATGVVSEIAKERGVEMPITEAVHLLLAGGVDPQSLVTQIMTRAPKREEA